VPPADYLARHLLPEVVGAHPHVAGVQGTEGSEGHTVHRVGQVSGANHCLGHHSSGGMVHSGGSCYNSGGSSHNRGSSNNRSSGSNNRGRGIDSRGSCKAMVSQAVSQSINRGSDHAGSDNDSWISLGLSLCLSLPPAGDSGSKVVGAETHQAGVHGAGSGGSYSVDRVGDAVAVAMVAQAVDRGSNHTSASEHDTSISISIPLAVVVGMVVGDIGAGHGDIGSVHTGGALQAEDMPSIAVVVGEVGIGIGLPLLPTAAGDSGSKVVGAETNMAGVHNTSRGGSYGMHGVRDAVAVGIGEGKLGVSIGIPLAVGIGVAGIGKGGTGTGHWDVGSIDTGAGLPSEGMEAVGIGEAQLGRGGSQDSGENNKELHDDVR